MSRFKTIDQLAVKDEVVLVRVDMNVPAKHGQVTDKSRLKAILPTVESLSRRGAKVVLLSHFGRPKGVDPRESLAPVATAFQELLGRPVAFAADCVGPVAAAAVAALKSGEVLVLENTRFHPEEEANDPAFAAALAALGAFYVNDAFSAAHRAHASTEGLAHLLPSAAGLLLQAEVQALEKALESPARPLVALVGGAKISTKLDLLHRLVTKVDCLILGGGMANTFLGAQGVEIGKSLAEPEMYDAAQRIMKEAAAHSCEILLPRDVVVARELRPDVPSTILASSDIGPEQRALDLGPMAVQDIKDRLAKAKTLVWNGPLGAAEIPPFDRATVAVAQYVSHLTHAGHLLSVAGGGDTVAALALAAPAGVDPATMVSTLSLAGGAFLEWMEGKTLPGLAALEE